MSRTKPPGGSDRAPAVERRAAPRTTDPKWRTHLTCIEPNKILVRGYALDEMMGRVSFADAVYLLLMGELPTPAILRVPMSPLPQLPAFFVEADARLFAVKKSSPKKLVQK